MEYRYGFPILSARSIIPYIESLNLRPSAVERISLEEFSARRFPKEVSEQDVYKPNIDVLLYPDHKGLYAGFSISYPDGTTVFTVLDGDLLVLGVEYCHSSGAVIVALPGGRREPSDLDINAAGKREFEEETGVPLKEVVKLSEYGLWHDPRRRTDREHPFLGIPEYPIRKIKTRPDLHETLNIILMPVSEWIKIIEIGDITGMGSFMVTHLALRKLGRLSIS